MTIEKTINIDDLGSCKFSFEIRRVADCAEIDVFELVEINGRIPTEDEKQEAADYVYRNYRRIQREVLDSFWSEWNELVLNR